jgi:glycerol-3-phosphate dehydrogenase
MRARDVTRLTAAPYDVLVVGGGIHGLTVAYECASRGLRTALVEARDLGSGASFNHQKTVHGGLRSLQSGSLRRARESILERRTLARIAPWFLRPMPFIVGTYRSVTRGRLALTAAFRIDRWLGRDRNRDVEPELHLPAARLISKAATLRLFPGVRQDRLTGAAQWYDYQMVEADRLTLAFAAAADRAGADLSTYVEAVEPIRSGGRIAGMTVKDAMTGDTFPVNARVVVNAAGSGAGTIMRALGVSRPLPLLKAMNLVTSKAASDIALAAPTAAGQMLTLVPWRGRAIVGTSQSAALVEPDAARVARADVDAFIVEVNQAFPALHLTRDDVTLVHRGIVPAVLDRKTGRPGLLAVPQIYDHAGEGAAGAMTVVGVKYTTARRVAETVVTRIGKSLGKRLRPSRTASTILPGAGIADHEALAIETARACSLELPMATIRHLMSLYAERSADIVRLMHERPDLRAPLAPGVDTLGAEVVHVIRHEMAVRLSDIVVRRTGLGAAGRPDDAALAAAARVAARELEWSGDRVDEELKAVADFYAIAET